MKLLLDTHVFLWYVSADPFDRIMIAQAIQHSLTVLTVDKAMKAYPATFLPST